MPGCGELGHERPEQHGPDYAGGVSNLGDLPGGADLSSFHSLASALL